MHDPFSDPIRFLVECHGRIGQRLDAFRRTAEALRVPGSIERHTLEAAVLFFRTSGEGHTIDEESSLFPRLLAKLKAAGEVEAAARVEALIEEHRGHESLMEAMESAMKRIDPTLGEGDGLPDPTAAPLPCGSPAAVALADALDALAEDYESHIPVEDEWIFPLATRLLDDEEKATIAAEMRGRRKLGRKLLS